MSANHEWSNSPFDGSNSRADIPMTCRAASSKYFVSPVVFPICARNGMLM